MTQMMVPVSIGEVVDKVTILQIKSERITNAEKVKNVLAELGALKEVCISAKIDLNHELVSQLKSVNEELWVIEDDIRILESKKDFGTRFVELARSVYITNDRRFEIKSKINTLYGSDFKEEKSYEDYQS